MVMYPLDAVVHPLKNKEGTVGSDTILIIMISHSSSPDIISRPDVDSAYNASMR